MSVAVSTLTAADASRKLREVERTGEWEFYPLGAEVVAYLRIKRKRLTRGSDRKYTSVLRRFALDHLDLELKDFEPPIGTERIEEFLDRHWGDKAPRTYNANLSPVKDFFKFHVARGNMHADPAGQIERARVDDPLRETFSRDDVRAIIAGQPRLRDRIALRLLLQYGLRKGSLQSVQFKHFDHNRLKLTVFYKGGKNRTLPIPDPSFWHDLERHILDAQAEPNHYLLCQSKGNRYGSVPVPDRPMGNHKLHDWWYDRLVEAGIVSAGTTSGERMHKARHTAGQRLLDATGNLKAVQGLLMHDDIMTTANVYVGWTDDQLAQSLLEALKEDS